MCQLLGMNCNKPAAITFSFEGFAARGGLTDEHKDGWGIAFYHGAACQLFMDDQPSAVSPIAQLIKKTPIKSTNIIAHIRKATQGETVLQNNHPFVRELWGRHWSFAHNGDLKEFHPELAGRFQPVGDTDSERAFCYVMDELAGKYEYCPGAETLHATLQELAQEIASHGVFNFMLSNGETLFAHCSTTLHYVTRAYPFSQAHLVDCDTHIDFARHNEPDDRMTVIATCPLTSDETWHAFTPGELRMFVGGMPA